MKMSASPKHPKVLRDFVLDRNDLIKQAVAATEKVVARQHGAYGFAVRTAYKMARGLAPNMIEGLVDGLLEDFLDALTPFYHEALERNVRVDHYIVSQKERVAEAIFSVTDSREQHERPGALKSGYRSLRPRALARMEDACPELGALVHNNIPREFRPGEARSEGVMQAAAR
jgi:hypothetical protein